MLPAVQVGSPGALDLAAQELFSLAEAALARFPAEDVYALSCWMDADWVDDVGREGPLLLLSYNTESQVVQEGGEEENRWNFACWLQHLVPLGPTPLQEAWRKERGTWYPPEATSHATDAEFEHLMALKQTACNELVELAISVVQRLHAEGVLARKFGRPLPVLIHDLEYSPWVADATARANPGETVAAFLAWAEL